MTTCKFVTEKTEAGGRRTSLGSTPDFCREFKPRALLSGGSWEGAVTPPTHTHTWKIRRCRIWRSRTGKSRNRIQNLSKFETTPHPFEWPCQIRPLSLQDDRLVATTRIREAFTTFFPLKLNMFVMSSTSCQRHMLCTCDCSPSYTRALCCVDLPANIHQIQQEKLIQN